MNVCMSKVIMCSRYGYSGQLHERLNGKPSEEVDCFKCLGLQMATDGCCERDVVHSVNEEYRAC